MKVLLDMHALLWWLSDSDRLGESAREIAIKIRIGKLDADMNDILTAIPGEGFSLLQLQSEHLQILMSLPLHHRDPFDHLLMAQAQAEHATFLSEDGQMDNYFIKRISCS